MEINLSQLLNILSGDQKIIIDYVYEYFYDSKEIYCGLALNVPTDIKESYSGRNVTNIHVNFERYLRISI